MAQSTHKVVDPQSTYDVIELIGTSTKSWEDAAENMIEQAGEHLRELRVAKAVAKDLAARSRPTAPRLKSLSNTKAMAEVPVLLAGA
jgi:flavin-binding protein dodecin